MTKINLILLNLIRLLVKNINKNILKIYKINNLYYFNKPSYYTNLINFNFLPSYIRSFIFRIFRVKTYHIKISIHHIMDNIFNYNPLNICPYLRS